MECVGFVDATSLLETKYSTEIISNQECGTKVSTGGITRQLVVASCMEMTFYLVYAGGLSCANGCGGYSPW